MKYYICEGKPNGEYNASSKARKDVEIILDRKAFKKLFVNTQNGVQKNKLLKIFQLLIYQKNKAIWKKELNKLNEGDTILIQYPILNSTLGIEKIIKKYSKKITIIALIHDMDSLRYLPENQGKFLCNRVKKEDKKVLNACNYIIAHNDKMKQELIKLGNLPEKIIVLTVFDYIIQKQLKKIIHKKNEPIIIAGNLSEEKAKYLSELINIKNVDFNLYGVGYKKQNNEVNINYKGAFLPDELLNNLEGSFGLVWDGNTKDSCKGGFGNYLRYNNPHKVSMYLAAGIPIIIWKEAALADFIEKNGLGITVENLDEISEKIKNIKQEEYNNFINNINQVSIKIKKGEFLSYCIDEIEKRMS